MSDQQHYEITITADAEVRDKDGNLKSSEPIEATLVVNEDQLRNLIEGDQK